MKLTKGGFDIIRKEVFEGKLTASQVQALEYLVRRCTEAGMNYPEGAYTLATVYHETAATMRPIKELGSDVYLKSKKYYPYIGYGYVQLTWKDNYARVGKLIGVDLIKNPEKALDPEVASEIMVLGMLRGWFTGLGFQKKRPVYKYDRISYIRARAIINGTDKAEAIAEYAMVFEKALRSL